MTFLLCGHSPEQVELIQQAVASHLGAEQIAALSDAQMQQLPFFDLMLQSLSMASEVIGQNLKDGPTGVTLFGCIPIYGDGSGPRLLTLTAAPDATIFIAVVDLRFALESLAHICTSPLGRYSPCVTLSAAVEKLAVATRIAALRDATIGYLSLGLLAEAQDVLYAEGHDHRHILLDHLVKHSFLTFDQIAIVLRANVWFQLFHEFGHYVCRHRPHQRNDLEHNLASYIRVHSDALHHQLYHDGENAKLAREVLGIADFDLVLTSGTAKEEHRRLIEARLTARQDKEELLCDNFAVQNTARLLVEKGSLGTSEWLLVRYIIEYALISSWNVLFSRPIIRLACDLWNRAAAGDLSEQDKGAAPDQLTQLISERRRLVLSQRLRLKYALEQFDAIMAILLHAAVQAKTDVRSAIDRMSPSSAMARILHEFSARHTNLIDRSVYTIDGLARCSSRGRAMQILLGQGAERPSSSADIFAFYVFGAAYHFD